MSLGHSVMNTDQIAGDEGRSEEAWVIGANPELAIRARNVSMYLERGGSLKEVRLTESEHGDWSVWLRLAGRAGEYRLAKFKSDAPKLYRHFIRGKGVVEVHKNTVTVTYPRRAHNPTHRGFSNYHASPERYRAGL